MKILFIIIIISLISISVFYSYSASHSISHFTNKPTNNPTPTFLKQEDIQYVIANSPYFLNMNQADLLVRRTASSEKYKNEYLNAVQSFTNEQKGDLISITEHIDRVTSSTYIYKKIPWKFAKVSSTIENGYPHTLHDVIILSNDFFSYSQRRKVYTLIHEKVHVLQRMYPDLAISFANTMGFSRVTNSLLDFHDIKRNNPDLDGIYIYKHRFIPMQVYKNNPKDLADSHVYIYDIADSSLQKAEYVKEYDIPSYISQKEHPYEIMGVIIPMIIMQEDRHDAFYKQAASWVSRYL